jgi:hypothetical protein
MNEHFGIVVYKELLEGGPYPKQYRIERNKKFLEALPQWIPNDLAKWMCKKYIDRELCEIKIQISEPSMNINGMQMANVNGIIPYPIGGGHYQRLTIQTPMMVAPFGISQQNFPNMEDKYDIALSIDRSIDSHDTFYRNIMYIERCAKKFIQKTPRYVGKTKIPDLMLDQHLCSTIRESRNYDTGELDGRYPPIFKLELKPQDKTCRYFNEKKELILFDQFVECVGTHYKVQALFQVSKVWMRNAGFGLLYNPIQLRYKPTFEQ